MPYGLPAAAGTRLPFLAFVPTLIASGACGPPAPASVPPGAFSFAALPGGSAASSEPRSAQLREDVAAHNLEFVVLVGGVGCSAGSDRVPLGEIGALAHPVVVTPSATDGSACVSNVQGGGATSLDRLRAEVFADPSRSLGAHALSLDHQGTSDAHGDFVENARWTHDGVVFATVHVIDDGGGPIDATTTAEETDPARIARIDAAIDWVRSTFADARAAGAPAVVVVFDADPAFEEIATPRRLRLEPLTMALRFEIEDFGGPVLVVHAGEGGYRVDRPLQSRVTRRPVGDMTRLRLPAPSDFGWVLVVVQPDAAEPFSFVPRGERAGTMLTRPRTGASAM